MRKMISQHMGRVFSCALALVIFAGIIQAQTTTFTYQGSLVIGGSVASGSYDLQFKLYDQLSGGALQGSPNTVTVSGVAVNNGVFTVDLDFGAGAFPGAARYLEISVRPASSGSFTTLSPRQQLTSTPYAIRSLNATSADTALNYSGSGASITNLSASNITSGTLSDARLSSNVATLTGDQTFTGNKIFSGVNGFLATGTSGSGSIPAMGAGVRMMWYPNKAAFRAGQVSGTQWDSPGSYSIAAGSNTTASGDSSVAFGANSAASGASAVAMGDGNTASGDSSFAAGIINIASNIGAIALGSQNTASGLFSTASGFQNTASGDNSTALGNYASTNAKSGSFVYGDNSIASTISATANNQFNVRAAGGLRFFASTDSSDTTKPGLFISGTTGNTQINGNLTVSGTFSGSGSNLTNLNATNISSGTLADALLSSNVATLTGDQTFTGNKFFAGANGLLATGSFNSGSIPATGEGTRMMWYPKKAAFRAGHLDNFGSTSWDDANVGEFSVAIGLGTKASGQSSTALGTRTTASGAGSVALGVGTTASGFASTALGSYASTNEKEGSFVYGDFSTVSAISATASNQFVVRAQNMWFGTNNSVTNTSGRFLETSTGAYLTTGGTCTNSSSRALKTNFAAINPREVLRKVIQLPIQTWSYKAEGASVRHIGAISQDFNRLFGFGDSAETISTVDADGVALAAIQGLHEELKDRDVRIERLEQQAKQQQSVIDGMRKLLCAHNPQADVCQNP